MFKTLYRCPRTIARHENGPLYESRRKYLEHLAAQGSSLKTMRVAAEVIYRAAVYMRLDSSRQMERSEVEQAAKDWATRPYGNGNQIGPERVIKRFRLIVCGWLRFAGRLHEPDRAPGPHQGEVDAYCRQMEEERGLSLATIATARHHLQHFFAETRKRRLTQYTIAHIEQYLAGLGEKGWTRNGIRTLAYHLRGFFLFAESQRWTRPGLGVLIRGPRIYRRERPPLGPSWPDVQRLLASTETDRRADIRDRAILLLLAVYGLRVGEVRRLCLEDVDWERRTLTIARTKQRRARICPLIPSLADAIARYIRGARPPTSYREIFIRLIAPHKPFRHGGMWGIVANRFRRLGIKSEVCGPHGLRHACATHLLAQGLTLTEVGGHLGHSTPEATLVYAKVDMNALRVVADLDLGGLL